MSKDLTKLVDNIYKSLEPLSKGQTISLSDDDIDKATDDINLAIKQWARPSERNKNFT